MLIPVYALVCVGYTALLRRARTQVQAALGPAPVAPVVVTHPAAPAAGPFTSEETPR